MLALIAARLVEFTREKAGPHHESIGTLKLCVNEKGQYIDLEQEAQRVLMHA